MESTGFDRPNMGNRTDADWHRPRLQARFFFRPNGRRVGKTPPSSSSTIPELSLAIYLKDTALRGVIPCFGRETYDPCIAILQEPIQVPKLYGGDSCLPAMRARGTAGKVPRSRNPLTSRVSFRRLRR